MKVFGCDEAGKGPVIGSMFVSCVLGYEEDLPDSTKDSKKLKNSRIRELSDQIRDVMEVKVTEITCKQIDQFGMTECSKYGFCKSILDLDYNKCSYGYIDSYINNKSTVKSQLQDCLDISESTDIFVEFSADDKYDIVSAASIVSKAYREKHMDSIKSKYGDIGSGYPSDPKTQEFLKNYVDKNGEVPDVARLSWSTCDDL